MEETRDGTSTYLVEGAIEKDIRQALSETVVKSGWSLLELDTLEITLEDIFLQLTREGKEGAKVA